MTMTKDEFKNACVSICDCYEKIIALQCCFEALGVRDKVTNPMELTLPFFWGIKHILKDISDNLIEALSDIEKIELPEKETPEPNPRKGRPGA